MEKSQRVVAYIRVSSQEQKLHGLSLSAQEDKLNEYAKNHNLEIVKYYRDEGISGRKKISKRPALQEMINDIPKGNFERIIFIKLDRYFRSVAEYHECQKVLDKYKITWTATEEKYDTSTANGRAFVNMKLTIAELEADQTGERIRLVNEYKIKNSQPLYGNQGLAFKVEKIDGVKKVVKDTDNANMIYDMVNHLKLYNNKLKTAEYIKNKYNISFSYWTLTNLLQDTKMYGYYKGNPDYVEPYFTKAEYDEIQRLLARPVRVKQKYTYIFSGLVKCPSCGSTLSAGTSGGNTIVSPNGRTYVTKYHQNYRCQSKSFARHNCSFNGSISERKLEKQMIQLLDKHINDSVTIKSIEKVNEDKKDMEKEKKSLIKEMERLNNMYQKGRISESKYDTEYSAIDSRLKELQEVKEDNTEALEKYKELKNVDWLTLYNSLNKENKCSFWRKYVKEIHIEGTGRNKIVKPLFYWA